MFIKLTEFMSYPVIIDTDSIDTAFISGSETNLKVVIVIGSAEIETNNMSEVMAIAYINQLWEQVM